MIQRLFIVDLRHPYRNIVEAEAEILVREKFTWAKTSDNKRHLIGSSAFFLKPSAERVRKALLLKLVETKALRWKQPRLFETARRELGKLH